MYEILSVTFKVHEEWAEAFETAVLINAQTSLNNESGCKRFDVCRDSADSSIFYLYEIYENAKAIEVHRQSHHYLVMQEKTRDWVISCTVKQFYLINQNAVKNSRPII